MERLAAPAPTLMDNTTTETAYAIPSYLPVPAMNPIPTAVEQLMPPAVTVMETAAPEMAYAGPIYPPMTAMNYYPFPAQQPPLSQIHAFWAAQMAEIQNLTEFKNHSLPLARIKKIMKADEDVKMIAGEVPMVFARACEMFILEITMRAWHNTAENKRRTLQKCDVTAAIAQTDIFDFLVDIVPGDEIKEGDVGCVYGGPLQEQEPMAEEKTGGQPDGE